MQVLALIAAGAAVLASVPSVQGHGYIVEPAAQWAAEYPTNGYGSTVDNEIWGVYDNDYGVNGTLNFFKATFPSKGYDSLGEFIAKNQELVDSKTDADCGLTIYKDSARSELPASKLTHTGFTHTGPCEVCVPHLHFDGGSFDTCHGGPERAFERHQVRPPSSLDLLSARTVNRSTVRPK